jgi:hypothetical protein
LEEEAGADGEGVAGGGAGLGSAGESGSGGRVELGHEYATIRVIFY